MDSKSHPDDGLSAAFRLLVQVLDKLGEEFKKPLDVPVPDERAKLTDLAKMLEHKTTRMVVLLKETDDLDLVIDCADEIAKRSGVIIQELRFMYKGAGATLRKIIRVTGKKMLTRLKEVALQLHEAMRKHDRGAALQATGKVWDVCKSLKTMPTSNCTAIRMFIQKRLELLKDAQNELEDFKLGGSSRQEVEDNLRQLEEFDEENDFDNLNENPLTEDDMARVSVVKDLTKGVIVTYQKIVFLLKAVVQPTDLDKHKDWLESAYQGIDMCCNSLDLTTEALYTPQDISNIMDGISAITFATSNLLLSLLPSCNCGVSPTPSICIGDCHAERFAILEPAFKTLKQSKKKIIARNAGGER